MGTAILFTSLQLRLAEPYHVVQEVADVYHMVWSLPSCFRWTRLCMIGWTIPRGSTWIERCPEAWNLTQCCFIFSSIQMPICSVGCLMMANTRTYIYLYFRNTVILENKKNSLYFSASTFEHLWASPSNLLNCAKCSHNPSKDDADWSVVTHFKSLLYFKFYFWKSGLVKLVHSWIYRHVKWITI